MNKKDKSILVIDSEKSWLEFCELSLKANGYKVYTAPTGQAAKELLASGSESDVPLILIDIESLEQDESAIAAFNQPELASKRSIVAVFPTDLTPSRARAAFKLGVSDCVNKPYDEGALLALIEQMLADHRVSMIKGTPSARTSSNVLVVEDNKDWQADLVKYLPPVDHITTASDYAEASEKVKAQPYDLVVIDLRLVDAEDDNFQGMDLIRLIREKDKERETVTQIIIVSAYGTTDHIREAYKAYEIYYYFDKRYLSPTKYRESVKVALNI